MHKTRPLLKTIRTYREVFGDTSLWVGRDGNVFAADPFETFSRFAAQMTIPCFTAATRKRRGDLQERLVVCASATILGSPLSVILHTALARSFPFSRDSFDVA